MVGRGKPGKMGTQQNTNETNQNGKITFLDELEGRPQKKVIPPSLPRPRPWGPGFESTWRGWPSRVLGKDPRVRRTEVTLNFFFCVVVNWSLSTTIFFSRSIFNCQGLPFCALSFEVQNLPVKLLTFEFFQRDRTLQGCQQMKIKSSQISGKK